MERTDPPAQVVGVDLTRILDNAQLFCPADSGFQAIRFRWLFDRLYVVSADSFSAGREWITCHGEGFSEDIWLSRSEAAELAKRIRAARVGQKPVWITPWGYNASSSWTWGMDGSDSEFTATYVPTETEEAVTTQAWVLLQTISCRADALPDYLAINPQLLKRFCTVKTKKKLTPMKMRMHGSTDPVLITVGDTFSGVVLPLRKGRQDFEPFGVEDLDGLEVPA